MSTNVFGLNQASSFPGWGGMRMRMKPDYRVEKGREGRAEIALAAVTAGRYSCLLYHIGILLVQLQYVFLLSV